MEKNVTPIEDLMREHGLLNRLLLIYEELIKRLKEKQPVNIKLIYGTAFIIRTFVEDYHERTEELYVFPLLKKNNELVTLVDELLKQHQLGRLITDEIMKITEMNDVNRLRLINLMENFVYMYRYHESREDTIVFFAFKDLLEDKDYRAIGEKFEAEEEKKLGENGFNTMLQNVITIEQKLGIYDLKPVTEKIDLFLETK